LTDGILSEYVDHDNQVTFDHVDGRCMVESTWIKH